MNSKLWKWIPTRADLKRRMDRRLASPDSPSVGSSLESRAAQPAAGAVRSLSTRLDRLAVEQCRGFSQLEAELGELRAAIEDLRLAPALRGAAVEVCQIQEMLIGFPAEEWRLVAYCRARGAPEPGTLLRFRTLAKPGMCVADIGANVGLFTVAAAIETGPDGAVFAFEPTPRTHAILLENIQLNGLLESGRVAVHRLAISDRAGTGRFGLHQANCGHNSLFTLQGADRVIEVKTLALDEAVSDRRLDLVKIDAEGAEPAVLRGMRGHIAANPEIQIIAELAPDLLRGAGVEPISFLREIREMGFEHRLIAEPGGELVQFEQDRLLELVAERDRSDVPDTERFRGSDRFERELAELAIAGFDEDENGGHGATGETG